MASLLQMAGTNEAQITDVTQIETLNEVFLAQLTFPLCFNSECTSPQYSLTFKSRPKYFLHFCYINGLNIIHLVNILQITPLLIRAKVMK